MRIGIDARYLSHGLIGGVHTYVAHLVPALLACAPEHEFFLYADTKCPFELSVLPPHARVRFLPWRSALSGVVNDLLLGRWMARDTVEVAHFPANYGLAPPGARSVITLHDALNLLPLREIFRGLADANQRTPRGAATAVYLHAWTRAAVRCADVLVTPSEHARQAIAGRSGVDAGRIAVVPNAPPPDRRRVDDPATLAAVRRRFALARPFVLADALKNPGVLLRAWQRLPGALREAHQLVFFSRRDDPLPAVCAAAAAGEALLLVRPAPAELTALYSMAAAFVFPSWTEGFGIPLLEAMACGAPVIASDRGAIPEVAGDAAWLVPADDAGLLAERLGRLLDTPVEAQHLRERGLARAARYTWEATARGTLAAYARALAPPATPAPGAMHREPRQ